MLIIIGGKNSSCIRGRRAVTKETPDLEERDGQIICDCGSQQAVTDLMSEDPIEGRTYILEHAYFALDCRKPTLKSLVALAFWVSGASKVSTVVVLTKKVSMIDKRVRHHADLMFDFS